MSNTMNSLMAQWAKNGKQKFNRDTFFHDTYADWKEVAKAPQRAPDYQSGSYSKYWFTDSGVYRCANHWGNVASCKWALDGKQVQGEVKIGFCAWGKFQDMANPFKSEKEAMYDDYAVLRDNRKNFNLKSRIAWDNELDKKQIAQNDAWNNADANDILKERIKIRNSMSEKEFKKYKRPEWTKLPF